MKINKRYFVVAGILLSLVAAWIGFDVCRGRDDAQREEESSPERVGKPGAADRGKRSRSAEKRFRKTQDRKIRRADPAVAERVRVSEAGDSEEETGLTREDRKIYDDLRNALDANDSTSVIKLCGQITAESGRELRAQAVQALGWFGKSAMAELTPYLADPDEDIASDALFQWLDALSQIEADGERASTVAMAMKVLSDENALEQISMELNGIDEKLAINTLAQIIGGENALADKVAKDAYAFITGEKYTTPAAAEKWLDENYEPEEPEE